MPCAAADIFRQAADLNRNDERRKGNVLHIAAPCRIVSSGDIHGYRSAFTRITSYAKLNADPESYLVFQEILHCQPDEKTGHDRSVELLMRAARLKIERPKQVLFVMGNHDVAQVTGSEISKYGHGVCKAFVKGLQFAFEDNANDVAEALQEFFMSLPLAVRCPNGVLISHSLPSPAKLNETSTEILTRPITPEDMQRGGAAYNWVWGRGQSEEQLETMANQLGVEFFLLAHQHNEAGYDILSPRGAVVLSDHSAGYLVEFRDDQKVDADSLMQYLKPLSSL
ncbi:MAG: hypothetical protein GY794_08135 [bacterium]|nr:hypothetical protein [bacterium]